MMELHEEIKEVNRDDWAHLRRWENGKCLVKTPWGTESDGVFATSYVLGYQQALKAVERTVREQLATGLTLEAALDTALIRLSGVKA